MEQGCGRYADFSKRLRRRSVKKRHFAKYENGKVYTWLGGATSWSVDSNNVTDWKFAKLAESEEKND